MPNRWGTKPETYLDMAASCEMFLSCADELLAEQGHTPEVDAFVERWTNERDMYLEMAADLAEQMAQAA